MIEEGSPPDLVLDLTYSGEMMKSVSLNLGLPTVTSSLGADKDIRLDPFTHFILPQSNIRGRSFIISNGFIDVS